MSIVFNTFKIPKNLSSMLEKNTSKLYNPQSSGAARHTLSVINEILDFTKNPKPISVPEIKKKLLEPFINLTTKDGKPKYCDLEINHIAEVITKENSDYIKHLSEITIDGKSLFDIFSICKLIKAINTNPEVKDFTDKIIQLAKDGDLRFAGYNIADIAEKVTSQNKTPIETLINYTKKNGEPLFQAFTISIVSEVANTQNLEYIKELGSLTQKDGFRRLDGVDIVSIIKFSTSENKNLINELLGLNDDNGFPVLNTKIIEIIVNEYFDKVNHSSLTFKEKKTYCEALNKTIQYIKNEKVKTKLKEKLILVKKSMDTAINPISVSTKANIEFWKNFLVTAKSENAEIIKGLDSIIEQYGQKGLPLEYKRCDFVKDLQVKLKNLSQEQQTEILKKLDIHLNEDTYEGFINLERLNSKNPAETEIKELCEKFLLNNKIKTGNQQFDKLLNSIIQGIPEFINIISKKQHGAHKYSLDIHSLKVLKEVVSNPKFEQLSNNNKMIVQLMALFHDIGKLGGEEVDYGHEFASAVITNDILTKLHLPKFKKAKIVELIKNHNWLQQLNEREIDSTTTALMFRSPQDKIIAEIFAEADLKGIGGNFYDSLSPSIKPAVEEMQKALNNIYSTGNMLFTTRILNPQKFPIVEYKGHQYRYLNISELPEDANLFEYGLSVKNKKDLRFLFHYGDYETLLTLTKPFNESLISTTMVTPYKKTTLNGAHLGAMISSPNSNIITSSPINQCSGEKRSLKDIIELLNKPEYRTFQRDIFLPYLSQKYNVSKHDYTEIYEKIMEKQDLGTIHDITLSNGEKIKANDLKNAYNYVEKAILEHGPNQNDEHVVCLSIFDAMLSLGLSLSDIPEKTLSFIRENNIPIIGI